MLTPYTTSPLLVQLPLALAAVYDQVGVKIQAPIGDTLRSSRRNSMNACGGRIKQELRGRCNKRRLSTGVEEGCV